LPGGCPSQRQIPIQFRGLFEWLKVMTEGRLIQHR
jgi:hypothetical protein